VDVTRFIEDGFVRIPQAFSPETAADARAILWRDTGCSPTDASTWTRLAPFLPRRKRSYCDSMPAWPTRSPIDTPR
jgi:hypothetical protein